mgnify:CR=1 FL=1
MPKDEKLIEGLISSEPDKEERIKKIIYDKIKDQYTIRIPLEFANIIKIDPKKHRFKFTLVTPSLKSKNTKIELKGELIDG